MSIGSVCDAVDRTGAPAPHEAPGLTPETRVDLVVRQLRDRILDGTLRPGERIRQEAVATALGTSRIPVREALRQLESEGLVSLVAYSGARVAKVDFAEYQEMYLIREWLEPLAIRESLPRLTAEQIGDLRDLASRIEQTSDPVAWLHLDRRFHLLSYSGAPQLRLLKMIEEFWNSTQQYRRVYYQRVSDELRREPGSLPMTHLDHRMLVDAIVRRDSETAQSALSTHIRRSRLELAAHREVFDQ